MLKEEFHKRFVSSFLNIRPERDEHFRALDANTEKGLDCYAGFEEMYEGIDTSAPVTYTYIVR